MEHYNMNLTLKVWRQDNNKSEGKFETYSVSDISSEMSFLEMFDVLIMIAEKASAAPAPCMWMASRTVRGSTIPFASFTCGHIKMAIPLR